MTCQVENLQSSLSDSISEGIIFSYIEHGLLNQAKQTSIKHDLEISHLSTKIKLLEETLNNK